MPTNMNPNIAPESIVKYGEEAVVFVKERKDENEMLRQYEESKLAYLFLRNKLVSEMNGVWLGTVADGTIFVIGESEDYVFNQLQLSIKGTKYKAVYVDCMGREILRCVVMDTYTVDYDASPALTEFNNGCYISPKHKSMWIEVEHSRDSKEYTTYAMKHATGAAGVGIPSSVVKSLLLHQDIKYSRDVMYSTPTGERIAFCVHNQYFKINGLVTRASNCIEIMDEAGAGERWLVGSPILSRYRNVIDLDETVPITLTPRSNQVNHA